METSDCFVDVESPKGVELAFVPAKEDDRSVVTHQSDTDSDSDSHAHILSRKTVSLRKLALVAVLAAVIGLTVGLGVGMADNGESSPSLQGAAEVASEMETKVESSAQAHRASTATLQTVTTRTPMYSLTSNRAVVVNQPAVSYYSNRQSDVGDSSFVVGTQESAALPAFTGNVGFGAASTSTTWPHLIGMSGEEAKRIIENEGNGYLVIIVRPNGSITKDLRGDRVFLFVNDEGYVERVPRVGR